MKEEFEGANKLKQAAGRSLMECEYCGGQVAILSYVDHVKAAHSTKYPSLRRRLIRMSERG